MKVATIKTNKGNIRVELFADKVPNTVANFEKLAGDNFYDDGVALTSDPQWVTKFEEPYDLASLNIPF